MEQLIEALCKQGICHETLIKLSKDQLKKLAHAYKLDPSKFFSRDVHIETGKNGARYVVTEGYSVPKYQSGKLIPSEKSVARNIFLRVEAIDMAIEDLMVAKALLK